MTDYDALHTEGDTIRSALQTALEEAQAHPASRAAKRRAEFAQKALHKARKHCKNAIYQDVHGREGLTETEKNDLILAGYNEVDGYIGSLLMVATGGWGYWRPRYLELIEDEAGEPPESEEAENEPAGD